MTETPKSHPRYASLVSRNKIVEAMKSGVCTPHSLIAHGRGEALDYLLGETTFPFAHEAIAKSAQLLLESKKPVLSLNGNTAALCAIDFVALSAVLNCPIEVNLFHASEARYDAIKHLLERNGAKNVLVPDGGCVLSGLGSNRRNVHPEGLYAADIVLVALEDGDRCEVLKAHGKRVIAIDLNPLSRTAQMADVTIVDNIIRCMPLLVAAAKQPKSVTNYDNADMLQAAEIQMRTAKK